MRYPLILGLVASLGACGKKSTTASPTTSSTATEAVASALTKAYPGSLAISVFPVTTSTNLDLTADDPAPDSIKGKEVEAKSYLDGTAEHCLPPALLRPALPIDESCYEFDQDMIYGTKDGHAKGTKTGKSSLTGSKEACLVSFSRAQVKQIEYIIDQGLGLQQAMICQAAKDGLDISKAETADGMDLAPKLAEAADKSADARKPTIKVTEAKMLKDAGGVYRVSIKVSMAKDGQENIQTYTLAHVPDARDNTIYHGVMSLTRDEPSNRGNTTIGKRYISVSYTRTLDADGSSHLKTELRSARLTTELDSKAYNTDGTLNYNAGADDNGAYTGIASADRAISNQVLVAFDLNTETSTGTFEYWQNPGSNYSEPARGMIFKLEKNATTGRLEGCGMSGAALGATPSMQNAVSIRKSIKAGTSLMTTGSFHPFFNLEGSGSCTGTPSTCTKTVSSPAPLTATWEIPVFTAADNTTAAATWAKNQVTPFVTRQCVAQNADGIYEIDTALVSEAQGYSLFNPTNSTTFVIAKPDRPMAPPPPPPAK
ncbi:MAG: hypothetical protein H7249_05980 [Chitinophagaceae bacterium]|nr:hypothetical protein [Oligoflexus sp.]